MDYTFNTKEELYTRVKPALSAKLQELRRLNYSKITEEDIKGVKIPFGKCSGRTIEDVASSPSDKDMLRFYSQSSRLKGTKVQLALLRACEIYGC